MSLIRAAAVALLTATLACTSASSTTPDAQTQPASGGQSGHAAGGAPVMGAGSAGYAGTAAGGAAVTAGTSGNAAGGASAGTVGASAGTGGVGGNAGTMSLPTWCDAVAPAPIDDTAGVLAPGAWPDSTPFCTDGTASIDCANTAGAPRQDGAIVGPGAAYVADAEIVTDLVTGLTWQRRQSCSPSVDILDCGSSTVGGLSNWRLPFVFEVLSLVDYGTHPTLVPELFPGNVGPFHAQSDAIGSGGAPATSVLAGFDGTLLTAPLSAAHTRCVRGGGNFPEWKAMEKSQSVEAKFHLVRVRLDDLTTPQQRTWAEALGACATLDHGGHTTWRVPSMKEASLMMTSGFDVGWTSTPDRTDPSRAWVVTGNLGTGPMASVDAHPFTTLGQASVSCVRNAAPADLPCATCLTACVGLHCGDNCFCGPGNESYCGPNGLCSHNGGQPFPPSECAGVSPDPFPAPTTCSFLACAGTCIAYEDACPDGTVPEPSTTCFPTPNNDHCCVPAP